MTKRTNKRATGPSPDTERNEGGQTQSMHRDVPLWCDTCCCEPEPRWQAVEDADDGDGEPEGDRQ